MAEFFIAHLNVIHPHIADTLWLLNRSSLKEIVRNSEYSRPDKLPRSYFLMRNMCICAKYMFIFLSKINPRSHKVIGSKYQWPKKSFSHLSIQDPPLFDNKCSISKIKIADNKAVKQAKHFPDIFYLLDSKRIAFLFSIAFMRTLEWGCFFALFQRCVVDPHIFREQCNPLSKLVSSAILQRNAHR